MHPAGFYFQGLVTSDAEAIISSSARGFLNDFDSGVVPVLSSASLTAQAPFTQVTGLIDSGDNSTNDFRVGLDQLVSVYQNLTPTQIDQFYSSAAELITPNSFKFDDDSDGTARPDFSLITETMDNEIFGNYLIDSTF